jgi:hypothetical protein
MIKTLSPEEQTAPAIPTADTSQEALLPACLKLRKAHDAGIDLASEYEAELLALEKRFHNRLTNAATNINDAAATVEFIVAARPDLFEKPKTQTYYGIRVGWMKQPGQVQIENEPDTIARIEKLLSPKDAAGVIKTTKKLVKKALSALPGDVLKKIGVAIGADTDIPFVKPTEGDGLKKLNGLIAAKTGENASGVEPS